MADPKIVVEVAGREVAVSNPRKVYFPRTGHTKLDLVRYYLAAGHLNDDLRVGHEVSPVRSGSLIFPARSRRG